MPQVMAKESMFEVDAGTMPKYSQAQPQTTPLGCIIGIAIITTPGKHCADTGIGMGAAVATKTTSIVPTSA